MKKTCATIATTGLAGGLPLHAVTRRRHFVAALIFTLMILNACPVCAQDKSWNAQGDQSDWFDDANWLPAGAPTVTDDAKIDLLDASAEISQNYEMQSLVLGGKKASHLSVGNFTTGNVTPGDSSDNAVLNRRSGILTLKGSAGKMTLRGTYKDSEEVIPDEPSFLFYVQ